MIEYLCSTWNCRRRGFGGVVTCSACGQALTLHTPALANSFETDWAQDRAQDWEATGPRDGGYGKPYWWVSGRSNGEEPFT